jgi:MFS family permease
MMPLKNHSGFEERNLPTMKTTPVWRIVSYFATIALCFGLATGIAGIPVAFYLKDVLKLSPQEMSRYGALLSIPSYLGFLLGYLRDQWKPLGKHWGDRGYFAVAPPVTAACYLFLASGELSYNRLVTTLLICGVSNGLIGIALGGFMAATARQHAMTGRLTSAFMFINMVPGIIASLAGGWLTTHVRPQHVFYCSAVFALALVALAFWKPVFVAPLEELEPAAEYEAALETLPGLRDQFKSVAFWCAFTMVILWNFCPGWGTPVFFQLTNKVKLTQQEFGNYSAIVPGFIMLGTILYSALCRWMSLSRLLWIGTILGIATNGLFLLIHSPLQAYCVAALLGFLLGMANSAFMDLAMRTYLKGREGIAGALVGTGGSIAGVTSDLFGAWLYEKGGFGLALGISTVFTTLILVVLPFIPHHIRQPKEGEQGTMTLPATAVAPAT